MNSIVSIKWAPRASMQFSAAIEYIRRDSVQNADSVKSKVLRAIEKLNDSKAIHRPDTHKTNNDGHFHYFELMRLRISYYRGENEIIIGRVRHVSRKPLGY